MRPRVDLLWLGTSDTPNWSLGDIWMVEPQPKAVDDWIRQKLDGTAAAACLFWNPNLGLPNPDTVITALKLPGHVWHAGLRLGTGGLPGLMDFVAPTWMLNCDPDLTIEATSWRLSLNACLILTDILRHLGGPESSFRSLEGAALEMGYRYITNGAFVRHIPWLIPDHVERSNPSLPLEDEFRFIRSRFKRWQFMWSAARAVMTGYASLPVIVKAVHIAAGFQAQTHNTVFDPQWGITPGHDPIPTKPKVSVLIPTLDRYTYLRTVLEQLRSQSAPPSEIIIIDQTPDNERDTRIVDDFADLPLKLVYLSQPGQCTSRNVGLQLSSGEYILFLDDDDEIGPDLIERHLESLQRFHTKISSGEVMVPSMDTNPDVSGPARVSSVFPTNNTLIRRDILRASGLFDLAYDCKMVEDGDLGTRIYLSGELMVLDPSISVLHHHAPHGGLRAHKARIVTYASSRSRLTHRNLPHEAEIYQAKRYYTDRQVSESLWLRAFGTFAVRGGKAKKLLKGLIAVVLLPDTLWRIWCRTRKANELLKSFPQIPSIGTETKD